MKFGCQQWQRSEYQLTINGNRGAQEEFSVNKSFKRNCTILKLKCWKFQQARVRTPILECDAKNDSFGSEVRWKIRLLVLLGISKKLRLRQPWQLLPITWQAVVFLSKWLWLCSVFLTCFMNKVVSFYGAHTKYQVFITLVS